MGWVILSGGNFFNGTINTIQALVDVFKDAGNTRTIMFSSLVGALIAFVQRSGGVEGFIKYVNDHLEKNSENKKSNPRKKVQIFAWLTGFVIFVESSINVFLAGPYLKICSAIVEKKKSSCNVPLH